MCYEDQFLEGYKAYQDGCKVNACPYPVDSERSAAWVRGWWRAAVEGATWDVPK